ncbi:T-lymphocyte activation antigen CD86 [Gracilinanus agilis]|uniref:T-lymphocyte activation antigen CD86 n=1 Tax=Gracilinanus agilis TaxID=191870 RepID=UPI001CFC7697|nr:T-lymphocyte activation antigen CD86 [Gracilinanus agilis]
MASTLVQCGAWKLTLELGGTEILGIMEDTVATATEPKVEAFFNGTVDLPCNFKNPEEISLEELLIFWQDANDLVLYELYQGREKREFIHPKYINRTEYNQTTWTLRLQNVRIEDQREYKCLVQHRGPKGLVLVHQFSFQLFVLAPFSQPEITRLDNMTAKIGDVLNFSCSAEQGYPQPEEMYWMVTTENSTKIPGIMDLSIDNITQLYDVRTTLSLTFNETTRINISCYLQTVGQKEPLISKILTIEIQSNEDPGNNFLELILGLVLLFIVIAIVCWTKRHRLCDKRGTTKEKAEDPGHSEEKQVLPTTGHTEQAEK